jgi:hypothetical protein
VGLRQIGEYVEFTGASCRDGWRKMPEKELIIVRNKANGGMNGHYAPVTSLFVVIGTQLAITSYISPGRY